VLSSDGLRIGWIETIPNTGPPVLEQVIIRRIAMLERDVQIDLSPQGPAIYVLMSIDTLNREVLLSRNEDFVVMGFDGSVHASIPRPEGIRPQSQTYLKLPTGWVAWDAYQDRDPYRVAWSLTAGNGILRVPKGRLINSVAVSPSGNLIAVSVSSGLNIGNIRDEVYVLRTSDGKEIFRRHLPTYTRTPVLFPSDEFFAYSSAGTTMLLRIPSEMK